MFHFYAPWKHKKPPFPDVFRGYRSETVVENELITVNIDWLISTEGSVMNQTISAWPSIIFNFSMSLLEP